MEPVDTRPHERAASVAAVAALAVSQPLLGVLGDNPAFFIARANPRADALVAAVLVGLVAPAIAAGAVHLAGRASPPVTRVVHGALFGMFTGWAAGQVADRAGLGVIAVIVVALVVGALLVAAYHRVEALRWVARYGVVVPVLVVALFVLASPTAALLRGPGQQRVVAAEVARDLPLVVIVLDELPTVSLLADLDTIDADRYPNIASLAADGVWYRGATTVAARSNHAVPALLSGLYSDNSRIPSWIDWPVNLMTILGGSYDVYAREPVTGLCTPAVCEDAGPRTDDAVAPTGWRSLLADVGFVALHVTLPDRVTVALPAIDETWGNFGGDPIDGEPPSDLDEAVIMAERKQHSGMLDAAAAEFEAGRVDDFDGWIRPLDGRGTLFVLHTLTPHKPWEYLPTGRRYIDVPRIGLDEDANIVNDEWRLRFDERRHLLQTGFADRLVGRVLDDLRAHGLYDEAMIVLVADHGQAFVPGEQGREPQRDNLHGIVDVPLIVKYPDGPAGIIDDRTTETVDIVPTIVDVLGIRADLAFDGASLRGPVDPTRQRHLLTPDGTTPYDWDPEGLARELATRHAWYGTDTGWDAVWHAGPYRHLIGRRVDDLVGDTPAEMLAALDRTYLFEFVPGGLAPSMIGGGIAYAPGTFDEPPFLAVAVNGRVVGIARVVELREEVAPFAALVPPDAFDPQHNRVAVYLIEEDQDGQVVLRQPGGG